ncbi:hypothetical protein PV326_000763, partial [Microctonus aethiopoides]
ALGKKQGVQDGQGDYAQAVDKNGDAINPHEQEVAEHHDQTPHWPWTIQIPLQKYRRWRSRRATQVCNQSRTSSLGESQETRSYNDPRQVGSVALRTPHLTVGEKLHILTVIAHLKSLSAKFNEQKYRRNCQQERYQCNIVGGNIGTVENHTNQMIVNKVKRILQDDGNIKLNVVLACRYKRIKN